MKEIEESSSNLSHSNYVWLKDYMEPVRAHFNTEKEKDIYKGRIQELEAENQKLKRFVRKLLLKDNSEKGLFGFKLHIPF